MSASTGRARLLLATESRILVAEAPTGTGAPPAEAESSVGLDGARPTCLAVDPGHSGRAWCGTLRSGVFRTEDGGRSWRLSGLPGEHVTALAADPATQGVVRAGTEPSALWSSFDGGGSWEKAEGLDALPSSSEWAFPPKPETHHVRWIACDPRRSGRMWLAIEAGALVSTPDGGASWRDRTPGGPFDTHELAIHPDRPDSLRVAAGDGYYESADGGESWSSPMEGLGVPYLRSVAVDPGDPDVVVVSGASRARSTYVAGHADGRLFRRDGRRPWERVLTGWPDPPETIAPMLTAGLRPGELWAADERGVHRSVDGGMSWEPAVVLQQAPSHLRGLAVIEVGS